MAIIINRLTVTGLLLSMQLQIGLAQAQAPEPTQRAAPMLEEIIVTAERREASLQETPISITAFDSRRLEIDGIANLEDIGTKVPSMTIEPFPTNNSSLRIFIRGVGLNDSQITQDSPVGIYLDGIYVARNVGTAMEVADLQRIEVLRGPQGTLYGRNSTGGAVNLITRRPSSEALSFSQRFTAGNRGLFSSRSSLNIPLLENLSVKVAYLKTVQDGFMQNGGPGGNWGERDIQGGRFDLRWDISDRYTLDYSYDRSDTEFFNHTYQAVTPGTPRGSDTDLVQQKANQSVENGPGYHSKRLDRLDSFAPLEPSDNEIQGHSLVFSADFAPFQFKYLFGYRELSSASYVDLASGAAHERYRLDSNAFTAPDGSQTPLVKLTVDQDQQSHELQFSGLLFEERVDFIVGAYYFEESGTNNENPRFHQFSGELDAAPVLIVALRERLQKIDNDAWAIFGQVTWTLPWLQNRLRLTLGGRHSEDNREAFSFLEDTNVVYTAPGVPGSQLSQSGYEAAVKRRFRDDSFSAVVEYDIASGINLYAKRAEAYKSGGFNVRDPHRDADSPGNTFGIGFVDGFDEEKVVSYELGVKSELFNRRLRVNAGVFDTDYEDIQLNFLVGGNIGTTKTVNAGRGKLRGGELEVTWLAARNLQLRMDYAYLSTRVTEARDPATGADVSDDFIFSSAPRHSYTAALDWTLLEAGWGITSLNISHNYMDARSNSPLRSSRDRGAFLEAYRLWNARLSVTEIPLNRLGSLSVGVWGKNLLDEEFAINAIDNLPHANRAVIWGEPRSYGADLIYRY